MSTTKIKEIEGAIEKLTQLEVEELLAWLEQRFPQPIDAHLQSDLLAGRLDAAIDRALDDEKSDRVRPL